MNVEVLTPDKKVFEGTASGIKMPGIDGSFEVLKGHAPLISALGKGQMRIATEGGAKLFSINSGFVEVLNNHVIVLVEGATEL